MLYNSAADARRDGQASNSILRIWQISFKRIREERPSAADLLSFMSFFNHQGIPEFMIRHYADENRDKEEHLAQEKAANAHLAEGGDFDEDVAMLQAFSLIKVIQDRDVRDARFGAVCDTVFA